jgi:hypothetical protein
MGAQTLLRTASVGLLVASLIAAEPAPASAQSLTIWGGVYTPLGSDVGLGAVGGSVQRNNSFAGGARLTFWGSGPLGMEAVAGLTPASVKIAGGTVNGQRNLNVFTGGLKVMLGISPKMSPLGIYVGAGPAVIRRGEDVTAQSSSSTAFGGVVGGGMRIPFSSSIGLRFDAEDYIYKGDIGGDRRTRNDLIVSTGLSLGL